MAYGYYEMLARAQVWAKQAIGAGYLSEESSRALLNIEQRSPEQLFTASADFPTRPMIVAFMGGTGVGKSSLLNRLAGQNIARVGVERPTSREVTLFLHRALAIQHLPEGLPLESIQISQHDDAENSHMVWIDMPDFDSVELSNKRLVLEWLPHIDVLLYVVSPERYRDNKAWQLLLAEGARHAWLFVMNQWDRGQAVQFEDFRRQLQVVGFSNPLMFRTSCSDPQGDDFVALLAQLSDLNAQHGVEQLSRRMEAMQKHQLRQNLLQLQTTLSSQNFFALSQAFESFWSQKIAVIPAGLGWSLQQLAKNWAQYLGQQNEDNWWDDWAQSRFEDVLDELVQLAEENHIPVRPLKNSLQNIRSLAGKKIQQQTEALGRQAMLNPGSGLRRFLIRLTAVAETLLPVLAMATVGYQVFMGYYRSAADATAYLGVDFAVHSTLLIGLSWLMPFFLHKKLQPSLEKAAFQGLNKGLAQSLSHIGSEVYEVLRQQQQLQTQLLQQVMRLIDQNEAITSSKIDQQSILGRALLMDEL